jgi:hypothetical protein
LLAGRCGNAVLREDESVAGALRQGLVSRGAEGYPTQTATIDGALMGRLVS